MFLFLLSRFDFDNYRVGLGHERYNIRELFFLLNFINCIE